MTNNEQLLSIINTVLGNNDLPQVESISAEQKLRQDLQLDSIVLAELSVRVEDAFDIDVFEDGMIHTVGQIMDKIN